MKNKSPPSINRFFFKMSHHIDPKPRDPEKVIVELKPDPSHNQHKSHVDEFDSRSELETHPFVISVQDIEKSLEKFRSENESKNDVDQKEEEEDKEEKELYELLSNASQQTLIVNSLDYFKQSNTNNNTNTNKNDTNESNKATTNVEDSKELQQLEQKVESQLDENEVYKRVWSMKHIVKHTDFSDYSLFVKHDCVNSFQRLLEHSFDELAQVNFDRVDIEYEVKRCEGSDKRKGK